MKLKLTGKELRAIGFPEGPVISVAMNVMEKNFKHHTKEQAFDILKEVLAAPIQYINDPALSLIAQKLMPKVSPTGGDLEGARAASFAASR